MDKKNTLIRIALIILGTLVLYDQKFNNFIWTIAAVTLLNFFPSRWVLLGSINFLLWLASGNLPWNLIETIFQHSAPSLLIPSILLKIILLLLTLLTVTLGLYLRPKRFPVASVLIVYILTLYCLFQKTQQGWFFAFAASVSILFGKFFWYLCYSIARQKKKKPKLTEIFYYLPFWTDRFTPMPGSAAELNRSMAKSNTDWKLCHQLCLKLLIRIYACRFLLMLIYTLLFGQQTLLTTIFPWIPHLNLPLVSQVGFGYINQIRLPLVDLWLIQIFSAIEFLLYFIIIYDLIVFIANLAGFKLSQNTTNPFKATNFHEFLSKMMYYYNQVLIRTFLSPIYHSLIVLKNYNLRLFVSVFSGVFLFGCAYQFISLQEHLVDYGFNIALHQLSQTVPYYLTLSSLAAFSVVLERNTHTTLISFKLLRYCCITISFLLYSFCFSMIGIHYLKSSWLDHKLFLLSLFGFH